jgi:hypothetical protein
MVVLEMAERRLDGAAHLAADGVGDPADLAGDPDLKMIGIVVAAIALVAVDAAHRDPCELFEIGDDGTERANVIWAAVECFGMQQELPTFGRNDNRDLAAELVGRQGLPFANSRTSLMLRQCAHELPPVLTGHRR